MAESCVQDGEGAYVSIPRGGPIYIPEMVGPVTRVSDFEASVLQELESLCAEINSDSLETFDDDISVDELKIITEEELVNKAFEEAFKDGELTGNFLNISREHSNARRENEGILSSSELTCLEASCRGLEPSTSYESLNGSSRACDNETLTKYIQKKRKRQDHVDKKHALDESYIAKVEQLSRIKQKQDEDKAAARLHSFNGSSRINECAIVPPEKTERMTSLKSISSTTKVRSSNVYQHIPVHYPEVILCIEIYHNKRTWVKSKELLVLGRQNLTELRDKIDCVTDEVMKKAGQHDPSGYFLIEDVFCNDLRDPSATDYSQPIFDWLRNSKKEALEKWEYIVSSELLQKQKTVLGSAAMPEFKTVDMQKTRFCDLRFRLGANYLYCHQGDCKHVIVIRDMRMIHPEDVRNRAAYPVTTFQLRARVQKCSVCKIYRAEKVTIDDKWAPENPCYFCNACYYLLHYVNQSLLYSEFSVYDYFHE